MCEYVLIMHSSERVGDNLAEQIRDHFRERDFLCKLVDSDSGEELDKLDPEKDKPEIVIVLESLDAFISHRLRIGGRPWVLAASFTFDDVYTLYSNTMAITELGIDAFVSNCSTFLKNMTSMIPSSFCWRPVTVTKTALQLDSIGTILDNLFDRDFSLVDFAFKVLESQGLEEKAVIYCHPRIDLGRLPSNLATYALTHTDTSLCWRNIKYYLPAPRITDLRGGVIPTEILKALAHGCHPLHFGHNALPGLSKIFTPQFTCLKEFRNSLLDAAAGKFETHLMGEGNSFEVGEVLKDGEPHGNTFRWQPSVDDFCNLVRQMYRRAKANAPS